MSQASPNTILDANQPLLASSVFDFLLIELVPMAERLAREYEASLDRPSFANRPSQGTEPNAKSSSTIPATYDGLPETEVFKDSVFFRLEKLGYRVGQGLSEKYSKDRPRFADQLDIIKFVCKDIWTVIFKKQIDNLKTNHRVRSASEPSRPYRANIVQGVYVLTDNKFRLLSRMSMHTSQEAVIRAQPHLIFPCGIIRGVLSSLGVKATVQAETTELPTAVFQIKTIPLKT